MQVPCGWYFSWYLRSSLPHIALLSVMIILVSSIYNGDYCSSNYIWGSRPRDKQDIVYLEFCIICIARIPKVRQKCTTLVRLCWNILLGSNLKCVEGTYDNAKWLPCWGTWPFN